MHSGIDYAQTTYPTPTKIIPIFKRHFCIVCNISKKCRLFVRIFKESAANLDLSVCCMPVPKFQLILSHISFLQQSSQRMHSFKSSPLLPNSLTPRFARNSRRVSKRRVSKEQQPVIPNPFRQKQQENYLPSDVRAQVEQLDYISPAQIQTISFGGPAARRSSAFGRHLQAMQNAAKKQEQMYHIFMGRGPREAVGQCQMEEQSPMTIEENDDVSLKMEHAFFRIDDDHNEQELNFFQQDLEQEDVIFYSQNMISDTEQEMQDDYQAYFDV